MRCSRRPGVNVSKGLDCDPVRVDWLGSRFTGQVVVCSGTSLVYDRQLAGAQCYHNNCAEVVDYIREVHKFFPRHGLRSWVKDPVLYPAMQVLMLLSIGWVWVGPVICMNGVLCRCFRVPFRLWNIVLLSMS